MQHIVEGECKLVHIDGAQMPADFMTKKLEQKKVDASVRYATNALNEVPPDTTRVSSDSKAPAAETQQPAPRGRVRDDGR